MSYTVQQYCNKRDYMKSGPSENYGISFQPAAKTGYVVRKKLKLIGVSVLCTAKNAYTDIIEL